MDILIVRIHQAQGGTLKALYGDPRGAFEGLSSRRKYHPEQFEGQKLDMKAWAPVFSMNVAQLTMFAEVTALYKQDKPLNALEELFFLFNRRVDELHELFGYTGRSMSVGDVIEFRRKDGLAEFWYCDSIGFQAIYTVNATPPDLAQDQNEEGAVSDATRNN